MLYDDYYEIYFISIPLFFETGRKLRVGLLVKQFMNKNPFSVLPSAMLAFRFPVLLCVVADVRITLYDSLTKNCKTSNNIRGKNKVRKGT